MIDGGMWTCVALSKLLCVLIIFESCVGVILGHRIPGCTGEDTFFSAKKWAKTAQKNGEEYFSFFLLEKGEASAASHAISTSSTPDSSGFNPEDFARHCKVTTVT